MPIFASGRTAAAFDEIFGKAVRGDINIDALKKAIARNMIGASFTEEVLNKFIDYVAYQPRLYCFNKVKFVAAMNHLIIVHRPAFTKHFAEDMPGMPGYANGALPAGMA